MKKTKKKTNKKVFLANERTSGKRSGVCPEVNVSALARELGVDRAHLSLVMNGHRRVGLKVLVAGVGVIGESMDEVDKWFRDLRTREREQEKEKTA